MPKRGCRWPVKRIGSIKIKNVRSGVKHNGIFGHQYDHFVSMSDSGGERISTPTLL
jgi:hypothetical protein